MRHLGAEVSAEEHWRVESNISFEQSRISGLWAFACTLQLWAETVKGLAIANRWQGFRHFLRSSFPRKSSQAGLDGSLLVLTVLRSIWTRARRRLPVIAQRFARSSDPGAAAGRDAGSFPARSGPSARAVFRYRRCFTTPRSPKSSLWGGWRRSTNGLCMESF